MKGLLFAKRNIKVFFKYKANVFFSLLSALILIGLYVLFLGNILVDNLRQQNIQNARFIMDSWIMAGVISVTSITSAMGAYDSMIQDRENKIIKDFYAAPVNRNQLVIGYVISSTIIGIILTIVSLIFAEIYILAYGGSLLSLIQFLEVFGVIVLSVTSNTFMLFFCFTFVKSSAVFATINAVVGTLIGFLAGIYMPIGIMPEAIGWIIKITPVSHSAVLLRQIMMNDILSAALGSGEHLKIFKLDMGVQFEVGGTVLSPWLSILYIALAGVLFFILSAVKISKKSK